MSRTKRYSKSEKFIINLYDDLFNLSEFKIDVIKDYLINLDKYLTNKTAEIEKKIDEFQNSKLAEKSGYDGINIYEDDFLKFGFEFRRLKLESIFLSSYSLFEHYLKSLCKGYSEYFEFKILVDDLGGNDYIKKSKTYLEKVVILNLEKLNPIWKEITSYQKIRNKIVHQNAKFNISSNKKLIQELSKMNGIQFDSEGSFTLFENEFIFNFLKLFEEYIKGIIDITKEKINKTA